MAEETRPAKNHSNPATVILASLGWPLLVGLGLGTAFQFLIQRGPLASPLLQRYFAGHPVSVCATFLFFVGLTALAQKLVQLVREYLSQAEIYMPPAPEGGERIEACNNLIAQLDSLPPRARQSFLAKRLYNALEFVRRKGTTIGLDGELKYLSEMDEIRQHHSYSLSRIIIWTTPMLGFLGTVIGITQALGDLNPQELATNVQTAMQGLLAGLYVAFDTTTLALGLSITLMLVQFMLDRVETELIASVDIRTNELLVGRFEELGTATDPNIQTVQRMCQEVVDASRENVQQQAQLWQASIDAAHQQWNTLVGTSGRHLQESLERALDESLAKQSETWTVQHEREVKLAAEHFASWKDLLQRHVEVMDIHQEEMSSRSEVLDRVVKATGEVVSLEQSLNENLRLLAGAKHFEETVMSLSAAIQLLTTRMGDGAKRVSLDDDNQGKAA